jgi:3-deoxy-D-manno-octulosonic-acid transferase
LNILNKIIAFFYNGLITVAPFFLWVGALFSKKMGDFVVGQKTIKSSLEIIKALKNKKPSEPVIWFHCASLGEFEQGRPVIEAYRKAYPNHVLVLTFFSPSGYNIRKNYSQVDHVMYLPLDTKSNAKVFVNILKPKIAVFVKYEFWPNFIFELKNQNAYLIGISVIMRANQLYFNNLGGFFKTALLKFDKLFVQEGETAEILTANDIFNFELSGDTRFDRVLTNFKEIQSITNIEVFCGNNKTMVIGSVWPADMDVIIPFINSHPAFKFVIAPHEINDEEINVWALKINGNAVKYSEIENQKNINNCNVLFINSVGLLSSVYQYANYVYVGGAFGKGLHNILEAAVFGVPIFFGNKTYNKFREATDLLSLEVAYAIKDNNEMANLIEIFENNITKIEECKTKSKNYINANAGASKQIMDYLIAQN